MDELDLATVQLFCLLQVETFANANKHLDTSAKRTKITLIEAVL